MAKQMERRKEEGDFFINDILTKDKVVYCPVTFGIS